MKPMLTCLLFIASLVSSAQPAQAEDSVGLSINFLHLDLYLKGMTIWNQMGALSATRWDQIRLMTKHV